MSTSLLNELDGGVCNGLSYAENLVLHSDSIAGYCTKYLASGNASSFFKRLSQPCLLQKLFASSPFTSLHLG